MIMLENGTSVSDFLLDLENDKSSYPTHENTKERSTFLNLLSLAERRAV